MKYVRLDDKLIVQEVIPAFTDIFPGVTIAERYSKEFLSRCLEVEENVTVEQRWEYDPMKNTFRPITPLVVEMPK